MAKKLIFLPNKLYHGAMKPTKRFALHLEETESVENKDSMLLISRTV